MSMVTYPFYFINYQSVHKTKVLKRFQCRKYLVAYVLNILRMNGWNLKGTATLMTTMFHMKDFNKPLILIPVSSKSVEKCGSYGRLNICKWTVMEAAIL